jgi:hypothetical protein
MSPARAVAVGMLGPLLVELDGGSLGPQDFEGRKPKQVLEILLVHQGQAVPKDRLAELLWGERQPRDTMRTLEAYVSVVRGVLGRGGLRGLVVTGPARTGSTPVRSVSISAASTRWSRGPGRPNPMSGWPSGARRWVW